MCKYVVFNDHSILKMVYNLFKGLFYWALLNISNHQKYTLTAL